jgi:predicted dehydrogenase
MPRTNVLIVGCGKVGVKRLRTLGDRCRLVACADVDGKRAAQTAALCPGAEATNDWRAAVKRADVDLVIAAVTHDALAPVTLAAVEAGKHVLVEKPAARCTAELDPIIEASQRTGALVRVGFNHRYHPAMRKAQEIIASGVAGELLYVRGRYGHGGRIGYDREWRADKTLSGGGQLIDQGVHLIDLARLFLGDFESVEGFAHTYFWKMNVEDNGFLLLKTARQQAAFLHTSCTEWKNLFSLEIFGRDAKLEITGLGGSYGVEKLTLYKMLPEMGPPETTSWEFPFEDQSWNLELNEFLDDIRQNRQPAANLHDARAALAIVEAIYRRSGL